MHALRDEFGGDSVPAKQTTRLSCIVLTAGMLMAACSGCMPDGGIKLAEWRKGVWTSGSEGYTVYTDTHYFVLSYGGDSTSPDLYFGASQVKFCKKGMARKQVIRLRQAPGRDMQLFKDLSFRPDHTEEPLSVDTTLFTPGRCNVKKGIIYDSITETTDEYILLATCNGDREKIFSNGVAVYMPAGGGEFYSYRIEKLWAEAERGARNR